MKCTRRLECKPTCASVKNAEVYGKAVAEYDAEVSAYTKKWPKYCQECGGWGSATSYYDPSAAGVSLSSGTMMDWSECASCVEKDNCPRCAGKLVVKKERLPSINSRKDVQTFLQYEICTENCGWKSSLGGPGAPGAPEGLPLHAPPSPECDCWDEALVHEVQHILVTGNPEDGFTYVGPFGDDPSEASEYADEIAEAKGRRAIRRADWWVIRLEAPRQKVVRTICRCHFCNVMGLT